MDRAAILRRVSKEEQRAGTSLESQRTDTQAYCTERGYVVVADEEEVDSGDYLDQRDGLWNIRMLMRKHAIDRLVVWRLDRLSRNQNNQAVILYEARKYHVMVESVSETVEDTPVGRFMLSAYAFAAETERQAIIGRSVRGLKARVERGLLLPGSKAPYGLVWADSEKSYYDVDPGTIGTLRRILRWGLDDVSHREIARRLTEEGIPTPKGAPEWNARTIAYILRNPTYAGSAIAYKWKHVTADRLEPLTGRMLSYSRIVPHDSPVHLNIPLPAILTLSESERIGQLVRDRRAHPDGKNLLPERYLLRGGYAYCAACGVALGCRSRLHGSTRYPTYRCLSGKHCGALTVAAGKLDAKAWEDTKTLLHRRDVFDAIVDAKQREYDSPTTMRVSAFEERLEQLQRAKRAVMRLIETTDDDNLPEYHERHLELSQEEKRLRKEMLTAQAVHADWQYARDVVERMFTLADPDASTYAERRIAIHALGIRVEVQPTKLRGRDVARSIRCYAMPFAPRPRIFPSDALARAEKNSTVVFPLGAVGEVLSQALSSIRVTATEERR